MVCGLSPPATARQPNRPPKQTPPRDQTKVISEESDPSPVPIEPKTDTVGPLVGNLTGEGGRTAKQFYLEVNGISHLEVIDLFGLFGLFGHFQEGPAVPHVRCLGMDLGTIRQDQYDIIIEHQPLGRPTDMNIIGL